MNETVPKNICIFGPQGSGKGTQAEKIAKLFGIPHISPGEMFRNHMANETELGKKIKDIINSGNLVPNEVTNEVLRQRLEQEDCLNGFIVDGYPRNENQANALDSMTSLEYVLLLEVPEDVSVERMILRGREDDTEAAIRQRLSVYENETAPLIARYEQRGIVHRIDGVGTIDSVWDRIQDILL